MGQAATNRAANRDRHLTHDCVSGREATGQVPERRTARPVMPHYGATGGMTAGPGPSRRLEGPESLRMSRVLPDLIPPLQSVLNGRFAAVPKSLGRPFKASMTTPGASSRNSDASEADHATHARWSEARLARRLEGPESLRMSQGLPDLIPPLQSVLNGRFAAVPKSLGRPFKASMTTPEASSRNSDASEADHATHARWSEARLARRVPEAFGARPSRQPERRPRVSGRRPGGRFPCPAIPPCWNSRRAPTRSRRTTASGASP